MPNTHTHKERTLALSKFLKYTRVIRVVKNPKRMRQMWERTKRSIGE